MIKLYYHSSTKTFYCREKKKFTWGHHNVPIPFLPIQSHDISFTISEQRGKSGPLVGILTNSHLEKPFGGNIAYFQAIQKKILTAGGLSFVFTPKNLKENWILGWTYINKKWIQANFPYPNVIYNRISSPANEKEREAARAFKKIKAEKIPYFNPCFFNKWKIAQLLQQNEILQPFLPETILFQTKQQAALFLEQHKQIYIKPVYGSKGNGIFILKKKKNDYSIQSHQFKKATIPLDTCWRILKPYLQKEPYIFQKSVQLQTYNNRIFDFRVLAQKINNIWEVTGIGIRMANKNSITTHVPKGGKIFPLTSIIPPVDLNIINTITANTATILEEKYNKVKEFSMDIGRDKNNHYWIFEVNAKPMSFDEIIIQEKRMNNLMKIFFEESGFRE